MGPAAAAAVVEVTALEVVALEAMDAAELKSKRQFRQHNCQRGDVLDALAVETAAAKQEVRNGSTDKHREGRTQVGAGRNGLRGSGFN